MRQPHNHNVEKGIAHLFFVPTLFVVMAAFVAVIATYVFGQTFNPPHTIGINGQSGALTFVAGPLRFVLNKNLLRSFFEGNFSFLKFLKNI